MNYGIFISGLLVSVWGMISAAGAQVPRYAELPDSPGHLLTATRSARSLRSAERHTRTLGSAESPRQPFLQRVVPAGMGVQPLTAGQKIQLSVHSRLSLGAYTGALFGAALGQLDDGRPHYGTDKAAFGERLGAASLRQASDSFFSYGLYAALTHEDPHYYVMGRRASYKRRAVYAASRVLITRTDSGESSVNWAKLAGLLSATLLTNAYYPPRDRGPRQTAEAYVDNLASSAATLELHEFLPEVLRLVHHQH